MRIIPAGQEPKNVRAIVKRHKLEGARGETYPFDHWATGKWIELQRGVDFEVAASSMRMILRRWAHANGGVEFVSRVGGDMVQFKLGPLTPEQQKHRTFYLTPQEYREFLSTRDR